MEPKDEDELKFENELEKLKQQGEFGAKFFGGNSELPPEMEAEWLKNIRAFEESYQNTTQKPLREILGKPTYFAAADIDPKDIEAALDNMLELLGKHSIEIDFDDKVTVAERYRFITEDLMPHEMDEHEVPGMVTHLMYEEFYPNHYKDIIRSVDSFCHQLFHRNAEYINVELDHELVFEGDIILSETEFIEKMQLWFDSYTGFIVNRLDFAKPEFNMEQGMGHVHSFFDYDAQLEDASSVNFAGPGIFYMHYVDGYWYIFGMNFPGLKEWVQS